MTDLKEHKVGPIEYAPLGSFRAPIKLKQTYLSHLFAGRFYNEQHQLYFFKRRAYDPALGVFLSPDSKADPLNDPRSINRYIYVGDNPVTFNDPTGESKGDQGEGGDITTTVPKDTAGPKFDIGDAIEKVLNAIGNIFSGDVNEKSPIGGNGQPEKTQSSDHGMFGLPETTGIIGTGFGGSTGTARVSTEGGFAFTIIPNDYGEIYFDAYASFSSTPISKVDSSNLIVGIDLHGSGGLGVGNYSGFFGESTTTTIATGTPWGDFGIEECNIQK